MNFNFLETIIKLDQLYEAINNEPNQGTRRTIVNGKDLNLLIPFQSFTDIMNDVTVANLGGIYIIRILTNLSDFDPYSYYIGQASNLRRRLREHQYRASGQESNEDVEDKTRDSEFLHRAIRENGFDYEVGIIETIPYELFQGDNLIDRVSNINK